MIEMLLKLGLSEKEAKVYLAALELGSSPAAKIAEKSQVNRPTTYVILEKLCQIGLATSYEKGKIQYFTAEDPEQLQRLVDEEELIIQDKMRALKSHLPELKALQGKVDRPRVLLYESAKAASDYFYAKLQSGEQVYAFTNLDMVNRSEGKEVEPEYRLQKQIATKVIYTRTEGPVGDATDPAALREAKFIAKEQFPFESVITTAPDSGVLFLKEPHTTTMVVIENKHLALSIKTIFDALWARL